MAGPSGLKLGGLVEGMCPNVLMKEFFRSVNGRGKMAAKRQDFSTCDNCEPWGYVALVRHIYLILIVIYCGNDNNNENNYKEIILNI